MEFVCFSESGELALSIRKSRRPNGRFFMTLNNKPKAITVALVAPQPIDAFNIAELEGLLPFDLSPGAMLQKFSSALLSQPHNADCRSQTALHTSPKLIQRANSVCRFAVQNDREVGALSVSQWVILDGQLWVFEAWAADNNKKPILNFILSTVVDSARISVPQKVQTI